AKIRSARVPPAPKLPPITPENRFAKPIAAIALAPTHAFQEQRVPRLMNAAPTHPRLTYASRRLRHGPPNSTSTSIANDPKAAKIDVCGWAITLSASANTAGMTIAARAAVFSAARSGTACDDTSAQTLHPLFCEPALSEPGASRDCPAV